MGDRHQQNGVNYTLDLNTGLTQVLSDGTNTYLYGNGRISQHATQTEYFIGDALGSVRQLTDATSAVTLTQSYAPYGEVTQSVGTSQTSYAYTGESRDANGLTYLRARYYASEDGRFISRDTWNGDYNRPLSLNRWNYVEANPVNLVDPSGHFPEFCRYAPTGALYEVCVLRSYGILYPISPFSLGDSIEGSPGCYKGIINYRTLGYLEGFGTNWFLGRLGKEMVYDFATMKRMEFTYGGVGINDSFDLGGGVALYAGVVEGLRSDVSLENAYLGFSTSAQVGISADLLVGLGAGLGGFFSHSDIRVNGAIWYVGGSLSADLFEGVDINVDMILLYTPHLDTEKTYVLGDGSVDKGGLLVDIMSGNNTVRGLDLSIRSPFVPSRAFGAAIAMQAARAYEEIQNENKKYK